MANGHGGKRPGSGRKPGSCNTRTRAIAERVAAEGLTPLEVLLTIMRTAVDLDTQFEAAKAAAPYMHPRLSSVEASGPNKGPIQQDITHRQSLENLSAADLETMQQLLEKAGAAAIH